MTTREHINTIKDIKKLIKQLKNVQTTAQNLKYECEWEDLDELASYLDDTVGNLGNIYRELELCVKCEEQEMFYND